MNRYGKFLAAFETMLAGVAALMLVALLLLINTEVAARYLFNGSTLVADEYGGYLMAWMTMFGAVHLIRADRHLSMTSIVDRMSPRAQNAVGILAAAIGLGISLVLLYATTLLVISSGRFGSVSIQPSRTPLVWPQLAMPVGYVLLCMAYAEEIIRRSMGLPPRRLDVITEGIS